MRQQRNITTVAVASVVILCLTSREPTVDAADGDNAPDFIALCGLYNLKDTEEPTEWKEAFDSEETLLNSIFNANLSTATESWLKNRDNTLEGKEGTSERKEALQAWLKDVEERQNQKPDPNKQDTYKPVPDTPYKMIANVALNNIHKRATDIAKSYKEAKETVKAAHGTAMTYIKDAIYGKGQKDYDGAGMANPKTNNCGGGNTGNAKVGLSIINDLICLCAPAGAPSTKVCGKEAFGPVESDPVSTAATVGKKIAAACPKGPKGQVLSASLIRSKLAAFYARIGANPGTETNAAVRYILGKAPNGGCAGSSDKECVNYKHQLADDGTGITWANQLEAAAQTTEAAWVAYAKVNSVGEQLKTLKQQAESARQAAKTGIQLPTIATAVTAKPSEQTTKEEDCKKKGENECKPPCKVVDEERGGKKCKLSEEAKQAVDKENQQGPDSKTNTTGSNSFVIKTSPLLLAVLLF
uniref:Variant surface glycoprotein 1125.50 n=1 Tax=Trypanosoma brucei TaxID=5691 RepID=A0A1J0R439_9TRYP|nr:variant surface glycoprotein 1125.50 [Trypanosoma brucei]